MIQPISKIMFILNHMKLQPDVGFALKDFGGKNSKPYLEALVKIGAAERVNIQRGYKGYKIRKEYLKYLKTLKIIDKYKEDTVKRLNAK